MDPLTMGLIGGGASLLGSIFSSNTSAQNTAAQIAASKEQQATQNAFTERMSSTAYQRADSDMKAAGLNPMMMFGSGSAASTPSGSSVQAPMPQTTSPFSGLGEAVGRVVSTAVQTKTMDKMADEMANLKTENAKIAADVDLSRARATESTESARLKGASTNLTEAEQRKVQALMPQIENASRTAANQLDIDKDVRRVEDKASYHAKRVGDVIDPIATGVSSAMGVKRGFDNSSFRNRYYFGE